ncbi:MAG: hypothetical protein AB7S92_14300 [Parvibaculaceae bacterium]
MKRLSGILALFAALLIAQPAAPAQAKVQIDITIGGTLWGKGKISCRQGARLLRDRGYYNVSMRDCRGRYYTYRAWRKNRYFQIAVDARNSRVVNRLRLN